MSEKIAENVIAEMVKRAPLNYEICGEIAEKFGLKQRAIVASATRNKIDYQKKVRVSKTGNPVTSKADLVEAIAVKFDVSVEELDGLEKATKTALEVVAGFDR